MGRPDGRGIDQACAMILQLRCSIHKSRWSWLAVSRCKPKQEYINQRPDEVHVKCKSCVARRQVLMLDKVNYMGYAGDPKESSFSNHIGKPEVASPETQKAEQSHGEISSGNLLLKWTAEWPTYRTGHHVRKEEMRDERCNTGKTANSESNHSNDFKDLSTCSLFETRNDHPRRNDDA